MFTGRFASGMRADCEREATNRGSTCEKNVTRRTSFLVIGTFGSEDWKHSNLGTKIQKAVKPRAASLSVSSARITGQTL